MRRGGTLAVVLMLVGVLAIVTTHAYHRGRLNSLLCNGACPDKYTTTPRQVTSVHPADDQPGAAGAGAVSGAKLSAAVAGALKSADLGTAGFVALDGRSGTPLAASHDTALVPASTTKLLTSFAALSSIDPQHRFTTRVVRTGRTLTLVGGGDPYLVEKPTGRAVDRATLTDLADRTAAEVGKGNVTLQYDASRFSGPATASAWPSTYVSTSVVSPISALWLAPVATDTERTTDAAGTAAAFAALLGARGVHVTSVRAGTAGAGASSVAVVRSATLAQIVTELLRTSNNDTTEVLLRQTAIARGEPATFAGGIDAVRSVLAKAGVNTSGLVLTDGSGLSRRNRISPTTLADVIWHATRSGRTAAIGLGLPVAGFSGTMQKRLAAEPAEHGLVRAKTGTLTGVHTLAGIATLSGGRPVVFAVMANTSDGTSAAATVAALDVVAAAVAGCACGG